MKYLFEYIPPVRSDVLGFYDVILRSKAYGLVNDSWPYHFGAEFGGLHSGRSYNSCVSDLRENDVISGAEETLLRCARDIAVSRPEYILVGEGPAASMIGTDLEDICKKTADETNSVVSVANYNCPGQIVITGEKAAVDAAAAACSEAGAKRCVPLKVSGPFHSAMLKGAGEKLADALESVEIHDIEVPYITNVTADYVKSPADVKDYLTKQVSSSVRWQQTIERLIADGADEFVEIGPGRSLSGFMRKINRDVKVVNIDKLEDFEKYVNR